MASSTIKTSPAAVLVAIPILGPGDSYTLSMSGYATGVYMLLLYAGNSEAWSSAALVFRGSDRSVPVNLGNGGVGQFSYEKDGNSNAVIIKYGTTFQYNVGIRIYLLKIIT